MSNDTLEPIHIHYSKNEPTSNAPRYWINYDGSIVHDGPCSLKESERKKVEMAIKQNYQKIISDWQEHFVGQTVTFNSKAFN